MRRIVCGVLVGMLVVGVCLTGLSAGPLLRAQGEFNTELHIAGQWLDIQIAFSVQDRGENDHGHLAMRIFDHLTGKLVAVGLSYGEMDVFADGDWVVFTTALRTPFFDENYYLPLHLDLILFQAYDGGADDQFKLFSLPLPVDGRIVIR